MKTMRDVVMEHVETARKDWGTLAGLKLLELSNDPSHYAAANTYMEALNIIADLQTKLEAQNAKH